MMKEHRNPKFLNFIRLRRRPRLRTVTPAWTNPSGKGGYFGVQARPWLWRNALMRDISFQPSMYHASADFAHRRMTHRPARRTCLRAAASAKAGKFFGRREPRRLRSEASFSAQERRWVWFWGTTGLAVGLH